MNNIQKLYTLFLCSSIIMISYNVGMIVDDTLSDYLRYLEECKDGLTTVFCYQYDLSMRTTK